MKQRGWALFRVAFTHKSWAVENGGPFNERLEFLGDAVLELCISDLLFWRYPGASEGQLTRMRQQVVNTGYLATTSRRMGLAELVRLGKGEEGSGGRDRDRLLAGLYEAVLGAIYLEDGIDLARQVVEATIAPVADEIESARNAKQVLHEWAQGLHGIPPAYDVVERRGPAHDRVFTVEVKVEGLGVLGRGEGTSKGKATTAAATDACTRMGIAAT